MLMGLMLRYICWFTALVGLAFLLKPFSELLYVVALVLCLWVPTDRVRAHMIRQGYTLPGRRLGWSLVVAFSLLPFLFGIYSGAVTEVKPESSRAQMVVIACVYWGIFTFGLNSLLYRNGNMWRRAQKRLIKDQR